MFAMMFVFDLACCHGREAGGRNLFSSDLALAATCWLLPLALCAALLIGLLLLSGWIFHYSSSALKIDKYIVTMLIPGETKLIFFYDFGRALLRYVAVSVESVRMLRGAVKNRFWLSVFRPSWVSRADLS